MTYTDGVNMFDLIINKTGSPYFTPEEKEVFILMGIQSVFTDLVEKSQIGAGNSFELTLHKSGAISPFVKSKTLTTNYTGLIPRSEVSSRLYDIVSISASKVVRKGDAKVKYKFLQKDKEYVEKATRIPNEPEKKMTARFLRHNQVNTFNYNVFLSEGEVYYYNTNEGYNLIPRGKYDVEVVYLDNPLVTEFNLFLDPYARLIVFRALQYAGVSIRENEFTQITEKVEKTTF